MRLCPRCKTEFLDPTVDLCPFDDHAIVNAEDYYEAEGDPLLGATIAGRFRIVGRLGVGAMGTVYRAVQASVERQVALKILRPDLTRDPDTAARFHREAHATSALKHPNTVTLYDFGQSPEGYLYIAMELLEGRLLGRVLKEEGALPVEKAARTVTQVARSLAEAHRKGIVHRDLKPDNIMLATVEGQEVVKVLDFGIAKVVRGDKRIDALETQAGTVFGTPRYMSPEQAQSRPLDARSDIYALGVIFYQMLTGHAPFEDSDAVVVMARHIKTKPRRPSDVRPDLRLPPALERLVMRMLEKDRTRRPQSAEELIADLARLHQDTTEDEYSSLSAPVRSRRRSRLVPVAAALASVLALLGAGAFIAFALNRQPARGEEPPARTAAGRAELPAAVGPTRAPDEAAATAGRRLEVLLDAEPRGARVFRNGEPLGEVPVSIMEPEGSEVLYAFELEGHEAASRAVRVAEDSRRIFVVLAEAAPSRPTKGGGQPRGPRTGPADPGPGAAKATPETPEPPSGPTKGGASPYSRWDGQ